jgi:hypothetical protein
VGLISFVIDVYPKFVPDNIAIRIQVSAYALSVGTTVLSTLIIAIQILRVPRLSISSHRPHTAAEIIVESAALYFISGLIFIPMMNLIATNSASITYILYAKLFFTHMAVCLLSLLQQATYT